MSKKYSWLFLIFILITVAATHAQYDEENILYYQMEPLDDSLFVLIQESLYIDPPDPKAEIIVDRRDTENSTIQVKGRLFPLLALAPELRARVMTYPFIINLQDNITYTSVFTDVVDKMKFGKLTSPPTKTQISATTGYINPYIQLFGGERFGINIKEDVGLSMGLGTPYSSPMETDFVEANFHILGFRVGMFGVIESFTKIKESNNHNNLYATEGIQFGYVLPFGNFFEISYNKVSTEISEARLTKIMQDSVGGLGYTPKYLDGSYLNYELRYPIKILGSTRGKFYAAKYLDEWHIGYTGRELSLAGSIFDLRIDAMPKSDVRNPQYMLDISVQRIMESWGFSSFALGPSAVFSKNENGNFGIITMFFNLRLKVGTSF